MLEKLQIQTVKGFLGEQSPAKEKACLFSTKDKTQKSTSKRSSVPIREQSSRFSISKNDVGPSVRQAKSFMANYKEQVFEASVFDNQFRPTLNKEKENSREPQFYLRPESRPTQAQGQRPLSKSFKSEPSDRLQRARMLSQRCRSFLGEKPEANEDKRTAELIPAGLREYLHRLKSDPIVNRVSSVDESENFVIRRKQKINIEAKGRVDSRNSSKKKERASSVKERQLTKEEKESAKTNCNLKLNCARKLTFDESLSLHRNPEDSNRNASLIVSLSEELLRRREALKSKPRQNLSKNLQAIDDQPSIQLPLSASTNIANANCFIMGLTSRSAAKKPTSVDLKEQFLKKQEKSRNEAGSFLQDSFRQAANPFRVFGSPAKLNNLSFR